MCIYIYIYIHTYIHIYIYIYCIDQPSSTTRLFRLFIKLNSCFPKTIFHQTQDVDGGKH